MFDFCGHDANPARHLARRASDARLKAMARRLAAPADDDEAAVDDYHDLEHAAARLHPDDLARLDALIRVELSREYARA